ncbi:RsmB/NOP family class I SAM-dependent RNA methyltransferase [Deferribacteraceae bacterium V6Fe1]|nr:RsmB/NOP family class I SAM-dependent RNA methyltransferase [Deferribacteraceae bacterium V6Fe1]
MLEDFISKYKSIFQKDFDTFFKSLEKTEKKYFRLNTARNIDYLQEFEKKINIEKVNDFSAYQYNETETNIVKSIGFLTGGVYIQNISSLFPPKILHNNLTNKDNPIILDMCAAPGGKTTYLSELLNRKGLIIANEISSKRLKALNFNISKYGAYNVKTVSLDGRLASKKLPPVFDAVMLDAPCSNENKILKNDTVKNFWSEEFILNMQSIQKDLLDNAFNLIKPGGLIVYSTCTFSIEENEMVLENFLTKYSDATLVNINNGNFPTGISGNTTIDEKVIRVLPHIMEYDGFFIALIQKDGECCNNLSAKNTSKFNSTLDIFNDSYFKHFSFYEKNNKIYLDILANFENTPFEKIRFQNNDFFIGQNLKEFFISTEASWEFGARIKDSYRLEIDYKESIEYLDGYDINHFSENIRNGVLYYKGIPVGPFKVVNGAIKNKLDRYFIYNRV